VSFVVDASVAIKWFVEEPLSDRADALLGADEPLFAPELVLAEAANIAWKKTIRGEIEPEQARIIAERLEAGIPMLLSIQALHVRALDIALQLGHPAYDCFYLACAEAVTDGQVVTADERLLSAVARTPYEPLVRHLHDTI
jgi:predicted nucleic acid-binding protein